MAREKQVRRLDIEIIIQHVSPLETTVAIECSSSTYTFLKCELRKHDFRIDFRNFNKDFRTSQMTRSSTKPVFQYVIKNATAQDEGYYSCDCSTADDYSIGGDHAPLILSHQIEEPQIYMEEDTGTPVCASKNSNYKYDKCALYLSGQYKESTHICFDIFCVFGIEHPSARNNLTCSCYVAEVSRWTHHSSAFTNEQTWHLEKPHIEVIIHGSAHSGTNVTVKCSTYKLIEIECELHKNTQQIAKMTRSPSDSLLYYDIQNAAAEDEGFYQCDCGYRSPDFTIKKTSPHVPLILSDQVDEPEIQLVEKETEIVCASKNRRYVYWLCILYQNGHQIRDAFPENSSTDRVSFDVTCLPSGSNFTCLCYTKDPSKWTRSSSVIVKRGKCKCCH
ncbi:uncharacterized protein LOC122803985 [Protopterus annectens]|uniref:uncharacterized protein LOC122803985 n=1 Tax=Protopterus annectens TaxID=7888 RepID=UPI001CFA2437|nr:uncharacterized protein LOC122803985 [Protopterus annectens]